MDLKMACIQSFKFFQIIEKYLKSLGGKNNWNMYTFGFLGIFQNFFIFTKNHDQMQNKYIPTHQGCICVSQKSMERSQTLHQMFCVSFSITGSLTNFILNPNCNI